VCRVNDELRHNPYVGSFHPVSRLSEEAKNKSLGIHNPHLGTFRHSPAASSASTFPIKLNLGFKGLLYDDCPSWSVLSQVQLSCGRSGTMPMHNLSTKFLATMPTFRFCQPVLPASSGGPSPDIESDSESMPTCAICLEAFTDGCELRNLACHHCFHKKCVDMWLSGQHSDESVRTATCPTCRQDAVTPHPRREDQRNRAFSSANLEYHSVTESVQPSPILLTGMDESPEEDIVVDMEGSVEMEINSVIEGLMGGNGLTTNSLIDATDFCVTPVPAMGGSGGESDSDSESENESDPDGRRSDIPDRAFVNVGRFLYASWAAVLPNPSAHDTNTQMEGPPAASPAAAPHPPAFNAEEIAELYAAIPDLQDESLLGSTYDLCGVPFDAGDARATAATEESER
jgi:hypothetical protein